MTHLEKIKNKLVSITVNLFFLSIAGIVISAITGFKYDWLNISSFIMILPAMNMWSWQWVEYKKDVNTANKILLITSAISLFAIKYIMEQGSLGIIPKIIGISLGAVYFGWMIWAFISASDELWKKILIALGVCVFIVFLWIIKIHYVNIEVSNISDIVYLDIFEEIRPPIVKSEFIKKNGLPKNIDVDYEEDDDIKYKIETLTYEKEKGLLYINFIDDNFGNGYLEYVPDDMNIANFLKERSYIKNNPIKSYVIHIKDAGKNEIKVFIKRNNKINAIIFMNDK